MNKAAVAAVPAVVLVVAGVGAYWWAAPHLSARALRAAAEAGDGDRVAELVDFAALRASLKSQLRQRAAESASNASPGPARLGAALGVALAGTMIDQAIDAAVTPQSLRTMIARGRPARPAAPSGEPSEWRLERISSATVIAYPADQADLSPQARDRFVFTRSGFADWRLSEVRLSGTH